MLGIAVLVAQSSALALQPAHTRSVAAHSTSVARNAISMQVDWEAREAAEQKAKADAHAKLLAHLRAPIRQYEGGWGDTALRGGGKDPDRFGTGPDANLNKEFTDDGEELLDHSMHGSIRDVGRRHGKYSAQSFDLSPEMKKQLVLPEESWKVAKMEVSQTDEDFEMECTVGEEAELVINVKPMFITKTDYFYGFTADSDPQISIDRTISAHIEGELAAKSHQGQVDDTDDLKITLKFNPDSAGEFVAHLCVMLPSEKSFSQFYKITGKSRVGGGAATPAASASSATYEPQAAYTPPAAYEPPAAYAPPAAYEPQAAYTPPAAYEPPAVYTPPAAYEPQAAYTPPAAFEPPSSGRVAPAGGKGFGGGEATRDPAPTAIDPNDPKGKQQAIHKAESFADYLARRGGA